ncbi:serine hydrolase domain-containing protein [Streptomyces spiramenti]|uniref:Beta-lactamase family protein n=1 Tax=Streptomyces spiramenti TaxID=2720606 RepID=A0ABX1ALK7_9ACTN|nr:serine hydrolase domain-containing protein [Streptomyces spiramenti]NJP66581.1 beta-lactamase family protein [Streptomyces spiramenti]
MSILFKSGGHRQADPPRARPWRARRGAPLLLVAPALAGVLLLTAAAPSPPGSTASAGAPTLPAEADSPEEAAAEADTYVRERMAATGVPGAAYAVIGPDGVHHSGTFGEDGHGAPVTGDTPFLWGSVAKPVTATLVLRLVEQGRLALSDPVGAHLPWYGTDDDRQPTVRDLLRHTSGLPAGLHLTDRHDPDRRPLAVARQSATLPPVAEPGGEHHYSGHNYLLLAAVVEAVTGEEFTTALDHHVLAPLGMDDAVITPTDARDRLPPGHRYVLGHPVAMRTGFDPAGVGYGYLGGTLHDLTAYARAQLDGPPGDETGASPSVPREQRALAHRPATVTGDDRYYGLGWRNWPAADIGVPGGGRVVWHGGAAPGYQAAVLLLPEKRQAVVLLQNAYGSFQENALLETGFGLVALTHGQTPVDSGGEPAYGALLVGLGCAVLVPAALLGATVHRASRRRGSGRRGGASPGETPAPRSGWRAVAGWTAWVGPAAALAVTAGWVLPGLWGLRLDGVWLWAPDIAAALWAVVVTCALLIAARTATAVRSHRRWARR